jgi:hypothetical protein
LLKILGRTRPPPLHADEEAIGHIERFLETLHIED